jgi:hypothetical protein
VKRVDVKHSSFLLAFMFATASVARMPAGLALGDQGPGEAKTALLSFPESFCAFTESSSPYAYIGFAFQIDGRVRYFKTSTTTCQNLKILLPRRPDQPFQNPMFGEQVTLYGGHIPKRLRRENGDLYEIEPSENSTTRSFFLPQVVHTGYENPQSLGSNPHPDLILRECRLLTDVFERDLCLWYQAGLQNDKEVCGELGRARAHKCRMWVANIRSGHVNQ